MEDKVGTLSGQGSEPESDEISEEMSWIEWFCLLEGHEFLVNVPKDYFTPENIVGLEKKIGCYKSVAIEEAL